MLNVLIRKTNHSKMTEISEFHFSLGNLTEVRSIEVIINHGVKQAL